MPQFPGSISDAHADIIIATLHTWLIETRAVAADTAIGKSAIANIVCDAVSADVTLQPLHDAYQRKFYPR